MATGYAGTGNWKAKATENGYTNNNNGTVSIRITVSVQRQGSGTLNGAYYSVYNGSTKLGRIWLDKAGWTSSDQVRTGTITISVSKGTSAKTQSYTNVSFTYESGGDESSKYQPSSHSLSWTIPALSTFSITYNANGGAGAPASQSKREQTTVYISSTIPTRAGYEFLGWATTASATTASYQPNQAYTTNANLSLYAVWEKTYASYAKVNGEWKLGITYAKVDGTWKEGSLIYVKENGEWKTI